MKRAVLLLLALAMLLLAADLDPPGTEIVVAFNRLRFEPAAIEVRRGATVTFHNMDAGGEALTVVASDGTFESRPLASQGEWSHRFTTAGDHEYFIKEHPETQGRATVR